MKYFLYLLALVFLSATAMGQTTTVTGKTINATQHLKVRNNQVDSISKDPNLTNNSDLSLPTQKSVVSYVTTKLVGVVNTYVWYTAFGARPIFGHGDTLYTKVIVGSGGMDAVSSADSSKITILQGQGGRSGTTTLVGGVKVLTISGLSGTSVPQLTLRTPSGITLTAHYKADCTTNTLTITAIKSDGTTNTSDVSVIYFNVIN